MKRFISILVVITIAFSMLLFTSCGPEPEVKELNWILYAREINTEGQILDEFQFALTATIPAQQDMEITQGLAVNVIWPDTFRLSNNGPETYSVLASSSHETDYFYFLRSASGEIGLAPEKGYAIFIWEDKDTCIVASTDSSTPIENILVFFDNMESVKTFQ